MTTLSNRIFPAIPSILKCLKNDPNQDVRFRASDALGWIHRRPDLVIPALIDELQDSYFGAADIAAESLGSFGGIASNAVPELLPRFRNQDYRIKDSAAVAISRISPETALISRNLP